jgi:hypothetical protein
MKTKEDIQKLQESFAACHAELKKFNETFKAKADDGMTPEKEGEDKEDEEEYCSKKDLNQLVDVVLRISDNLYSYVAEVDGWNYEKWDKHLVGHIPSIIGAEKMNKALKVLGLSEDYVAQPKVIYSSKNNYVLEVEMPSKR